MSYRIAVDSCGELPEEQKQDDRFVSVPLELQIEDYRVTDDENFNQAEFLKRIDASEECAKSACPSPEKYLDAYRGEFDHIYAVTLSSKLSGSYNSAVLAKNLYEEECSGKQIHVFDSCSASVGETLIALKAQECEEAGMSFQEVVTTVESYIAEQQTFFVLENLDTLRKNGRLSNLKAFVASALNIKPVLGATPDGNICQLGQARGVNNALDRMVREVIAKTKNCEKKILGISHCNCPERAKMVKEKLEKLVKFKDIIVLNTAGVSTMYANDGGIIVVV